MDLTDILWDQYRYSQLRDANQEIDRLTAERDLAGWNVRELATENASLRLRVGVLVRLLIAKEVITAQEYAALIAETQAGAGNQSPPAGLSQ